MTVIAWDGKTLAADKQCTNAGHGSTCTKIHRCEGGVVAFHGDESHAMQLLKWFDSGRDPAKWPLPTGKDTADAVFVSYDRKLWKYSGPYGALVEDPFAAAGSGRDYALAAMYLGKTARDAVLVASALDVYCGNGVDALEVGSL